MIYSSDKDPDHHLEIKKEVRTPSPESDCWKSKSLGKVTLLNLIFV
jgi:hypothetical protein